MKSIELNPFVEPSKYPEIVRTLIDNVPYIGYNESNGHLIIQKKDMIFEVNHPEEIAEMMQYMFLVNNFICRQYRRRKHVLKYTRLLDK